MEGYSWRMIAMFTVLALCKQSLAEWNVTQEPANRSVSCGPHGNKSNCTETVKTAKWSGHFTKCPKEFRHYCVHGKCRFVREQNTPSCVCPHGYLGSRCEYLDFDLLVGDQRQVIIASVIAVLVFLILLIVLICICAHRNKLCRRKNRREKRENREEGLNMMSLRRENGESRNERYQRSLISEVHCGSCPVLVSIMEPLPHLWKRQKD
ncbi:hypothetical protein COCON_G00172540 [Conger conger]|uniref:EGF-like domain-containing protein n=1 Tax=Conger conger TaxID=82655 RepID=A0A9Q1HUG3_CONCO|nr:hypothetical protein COCON_G00172540 [Conger conger]